MSEIEELRQQLAEKDAEIEHLDRTKAEWKNTAKLLDEKLATSQAREAQQSADFCDAIELAISLGLEAHIFLECWNEGDWDGCKEYGFEPSATLREPWSAMQDTTILEAMIAEAGEVMRVRCVGVIGPYGNTRYLTSYEEGCEDTKAGIDTEIRALPGVTPGDLQK